MKNERHSFVSPLVAAVTALTVSPAFAAPAAVAPAPTQSKDFSRINKLVTLPQNFKVADDGSIKAEDSKWSVEREGDGTELFTAKKGPETRIAAMRTATGLESFTSFTLKDAPKGTTTKPESSSSVFFDNGKIAAFTSCEDPATKDSPGRTCVTATPKLCQTLRKAEPVVGEIVKEMDLYEMRALATILTLRGPDHQLDNVIRSGNRLGLKSSLQTTKGQLVALSRQVAKEVDRAKAKTAGDTEKRDPAAEQKTDSKSEAKVDSKTAAVEDDTLVRAHLERTIPRLRQACVETGFLDLK